MSIRCGFNVRHAKQYNRFMRDVQRRYDDERFYADIGDEPIERTRAYDLGLEGPQRKCRTALNPVDMRMRLDAIRLTEQEWRRRLYATLGTYREPAEEMERRIARTTRTWRKRYVWSDDMPPVPLDALKLYDAGLERYRLVTEIEAADDAAYWADHYEFN